jgi:hypothetical protein
MTLKEVEGILGPDGYQTNRGVIVAMSGMMSHRWWIGDDVIIVISVEPTNEAPFEELQVTEKEYQPLPPESFLERLRRLMPWTKPRCIYCFP